MTVALNNSQTVPNGSRTWDQSNLLRTTRYYLTFDQWLHGKGAARIVPDNPVHFHRLDNCSCIVLPSDVHVGRLVGKVLALYF